MVLIKYLLKERKDNERYMIEIEAQISRRLWGSHPPYVQNLK